MTPEQAADKVYAATGVLLGTDKAPHIASYMTVMETRIAELEAALDQLLDDMRDGLCVCQQAKDEARAALAGGEDENDNH